MWGRKGARIVFRLSTTRRMTYTVVAAAVLSSLIWNQGALGSRADAARQLGSCFATAALRASASASPRPALREPKEPRGTCRRCTARPPSRSQPPPFPGSRGLRCPGPSLRNANGCPARVPPRQNACGRSSAEPEYPRALARLPQASARTQPSAGHQLVFFADPFALLKTSARDRYG